MEDIGPNPELLTQIPNAFKDYENMTVRSEKTKNGNNNNKKRKSKKVPFQIELLIKFTTKLYF